MIISMDHDKDPLKQQALKCKNLDIFHHYTNGSYTNFSTFVMA